MKIILATLSILAWACTVSACPLTGVTYAPVQQAAVVQQVQYAPVQAVQYAPVQVAAVQYTQAAVVAAPVQYAPSCALNSCGGAASLPAYGLGGPVATPYAFGVQRSFGVGYGVGYGVGVQRSVFVQRGFVGGVGVQRSAFIGGGSAFIRQNTRIGPFGGVRSSSTTIIR